MDTLTSQFVNLGFGGMAVGAFVWVLVHVLTVTLPKMQNDFRTDLSEARKEYLASLARMEQQWDAATKAICDRLDRLTQRVDVLDSRRHPQAEQTYDDWRQAGQQKKGGQG